ncbi:iron-siderophore ABC transporter substrate-binding protein [Flaviflexus huanghaiensis]|uniref:iron-siderophore ABC transporter substrate-binding protein n=1 Tax=Flaviflexus huanghaiensis TaxID=1111473 RepID=UPI0015FA058D|nr:iron-siderophore ABC transporter substrate-binding protein [Flaviflexus huanghaiensis]
MTSRRFAAVLAAAALSTTLAACSDDGGPSEEGSAVDTTTDENAADADGFPVTISHAFGETVIEEKPERVATVAWSNHEVPLALGIVPVGMEKATWGDDDGDGILPWVDERLAELDAESPVLFDATDSIPFDSVNNTTPDVILASYSGLTQDDYDQLSKIAPVVAYPDVAWGTSLNEMISMNSTALGMVDEGEDLIDTIQADIDAASSEHPMLEGTVPLFMFIDGSDTSKIGFYTPLDPRAGFLLDNGFEEADILAENADSESFYVEISAENPEAFEDVDLFITYGSDDEAENAASLEAWQADPLLSRIPAIADGRVAFLGNGPLAAAANPSPLSVSWGISDYFALLEDALG